MGIRLYLFLIMLTSGQLLASDCLNHYLQSNFQLNFTYSGKVSDQIVSGFNERQHLRAVSRKRLRKISHYIQDSYDKGRELREIQERYRTLMVIDNPSKDVLDEMHDLGKKYEFKNAEMEELNVKFLTELHDIYKVEGISSKLETVDGSMVLKLDFAVSQTDEHAFEFYRNISSKFGLSQITLSLKENASMSSGGFFQSASQRLEMGPYQGLALLEEYANSVGKHEARHAMFFAKRNTGDASIFHTQFMAPGEKILGDGSNIYQRYMSVEEIYTYSTDLQTLAQLMKGKYLTDATARSSLLSQIAGENQMLNTLSKTTSEVSDTMITSLNKMLDNPAPPKIQISKKENGNFEVTFADEFNRSTTMTYVSAEEREIFNKILALSDKKKIAMSEILTTRLVARNISPDDFTKRLQSNTLTLEEKSLFDNVLETFDSTPAGIALLNEGREGIREILQQSRTRLENIKKVAVHQADQSQKLETMMNTYKTKPTPELFDAIKHQMFFMAKAVKEDYNGFILKQ